MKVGPVQVLPRYRQSPLSAGHGGSRLSMYSYTEKEAIDGLCKTWIAQMDLRKNRRQFNFRDGNPAGKDEKSRKDSPATNALKLMKAASIASKIPGATTELGKMEFTVLAKQNHDIVGLAIWALEDDGKPGISFVFRSPDSLTIQALNSRSARTDAKKPLGVVPLFIDFIVGEHNSFVVHDPSAGFERALSNATQIPHSHPSGAHDKSYRLTHRVEGGQLVEVER